MLDPTEKTLLVIDDEVAIEREFGYKLARCPVPFDKACLNDAEWGHPCGRGEDGERHEECLRQCRSKQEPQKIWTPGSTK